MSDTETTAPKYRTITISDAPPVRIREDLWPVVAHGSYDWHDNQFRSQANRTVDINIRVRRHGDGRAIVYGLYDYSTAYQGAAGTLAKSGSTLPADCTAADIVSAIRAVQAELTDKVGERESDIRATADECIADLPAQDLDEQTLSDGIDVAQRYAAYVALMDDALREPLHAALCGRVTDAQFLAAYQVAHRAKYGSELTI